MYLQLKNRNFYLVVGLDLLCFALAHLSAYLVRFDFVLTSGEVADVVRMLPFILPVKFAAFLLFGLYRGMWRYTSLDDLRNLLKAASVASLILVAGILYVHRFQGFSRGVFVLDWCLTLFLAGGLRIAIRQFHTTFSRLDDGRIAIRTGKRRNGRRTLIVGAGDAGEKTFRELEDNSKLPYDVVGFVDDEPRKRGMSIHGRAVLGSVKELPELVAGLKIEEVLITVPSATRQEMRRIVEACKQAGVSHKTLPGLGELIEGKVSIKSLREVRYEDLLGRPPVEIRSQDIREYLEGKRVLVTGAGGSIGSELCRQIVRFEPETLVLLEAAEPNLYAIQMQMEHEFGFPRCCAILAKAQMPSLVDAVMKKHRPHVVLHAAAYKHVPLLEANPWEAVFHNIKGSRMVMEKAVEHGVERFVLVSTDKAVRPANVMGTSKRVAELILAALQGTSTRMMAVRFGNVVGSSGSVVPLFQQQIARGGPVTVTHPEVMRYFMTIPEACQLILQAGAIGQGGEIFVLHMGTPVRIADMARDLIRLSGKEPDEDIEIVFTGLRPGEKLYEELITMGEGIVATSHDRIMVLKDGGNWNGHATQEDFRRWLLEGIEELCELAKQQDACGIRAKLKELVPEYAPQESESVF